MSTAPAMTDRHLPALILTFLALVLFAVGLVNRLQPPAGALTVGALNLQPAVLSCVAPRCGASNQGDWPSA